MSILITCPECGRELPERSAQTGKLNFVRGICKSKCYSRNYSNKTRAANSKIDRSDPFSRTASEVTYYEDTGWDCQRNQDILLRGLASS